MTIRQHGLGLALLIFLLAGCAPPARGDQPGDASGAATRATAAASPVAPRRPTQAPTSTPLAPTRAPAPAPSQAPALPSYDLVLRGGTLVDGSGRPPLSDAAIAIRAGQIAAVGPASALVFAPGTPVRDLPGSTFLPGFIDAHVHTWELADDQLAGWTAAGVTTVRDLGGPLAALVARRDALAAAGDARMPRMLVAGPIITVPGGHPLPIDGLSDRVLAVRGPDDAAAQTARVLDGGADLIKIAVSGRTDTGWPELSDAEIRAITDTAHARGARVSAHVDRAAALRRAVMNGIDDAAHMPRDRMPDDLIAEMVARDVALVPTIDVYENLAEERGNAQAWRQAILPVMYDNLARFVAAGGTIALGDDYGNPRVELGMPLPEIRHWLAAGLTPMQAIVATTHGGAVVCGREQEFGLLKPGMAADILVVAGDPLADIAALGQVMIVVRAGAIADER